MKTRLERTERTIDRGTGRRARRQNLGERRDDLGGIAMWAMGLFITAAVFLAASVLPIEPPLFTIVLILPLGSLLLAPKLRIERLVIDGPILLICAWTALSIAWSLERSQAIFQVRRDVVLLVFISVAISLIPIEHAIKAVLRALHLGVWVTAAAIAFLPEARAHLPNDLSLYENAYPGWHGMFIHKNTMAPFLIFAGLTIIYLDKTNWRKVLSLGAIIVMLIGSQSGTGLSALLFVMALLVWFRAYRRTQGRSATTFVMASFSVAIVALIAAALSLSAITSAYGKDLTFSGRTDIWNAALNAALESPWLGYGQGGVYWNANSVTRTIWNEVGFTIPHSHSGALDVWLTLGAVGLGLFAIKFISTITLGIRLLDKHPAIAEWVLTVTAAQLLMGLSESVYIGDWLAYAAVMRTIMLMTIHNDRHAPKRLYDAEPEPTKPSRSRRHERAGELVNARTATA